MSGSGVWDRGLPDGVGEKVGDSQLPPVPSGEGPNLYGHFAELERRTAEWLIDRELERGGDLGDYGDMTMIEEVYRSMNLQDRALHDALMVALLCRQTDHANAVVEAESERIYQEALFAGDDQPQDERVAAMWRRIQFRKNTGRLTW